MHVIETRSASAFADAAADWLCGHLNAAPESVLALPTGNTPLPVYAELIARARQGTVQFDRARIFNLDEYCGVGASDPHSFAAYMQRHVVSPLGIRPAQVRLLRGDAVDLQAECRAYDEAIGECGGLDLCVLGLGANGHVAFNEPGTPWNLFTHVAALSESTRAAQRGTAAASDPRDAWQVPDRGITIGIATLRAARRILLLVGGAGKEAAEQALYRGMPSLECPVTSLVEHPDLTIIRSQEVRGPAR